MKTSRNDHFFIYPKDQHGKHLGSTICVLLRNGMMFHGEAYCGPKDQFCKAIGRKIAFERAEKEFQRYERYWNGTENYN